MYKVINIVCDHELYLVKQAPQNAPIKNRFNLNSNNNNHHLMCTLTILHAFLSLMNNIYGVEVGIEETHTKYK